MTSIVVDFAWTKPSVTQLKSWGALAVGMYVSHDASKNANLTIVKAYAAAGIKSFIFFEDAANRAVGGYAAGAADAAFAYATAAQYGKPSWAPIIPAIDFDVPDFAPGFSDPMAKLGPVGQYLKAWKDYDNAHGIANKPVYGNYYVVSRAVAAGLCDLGVQTLAWSGGQVDLKDTVLYQNGVMLDNGNVDVEVIESATGLAKLAWLPGEADPNAPAPVWTYGAPGLHIDAIGHESVKFTTSRPSGAPVAADHVQLFVYRGTSPSAKTIMPSYPRDEPFGTVQVGSLDRGVTYTMHVVAAGSGESHVRPYTYASATFTTG